MPRKIPRRTSKATVTAKVEVREKGTKKLLAQRITHNAHNMPVEPGEASVSAGHDLKMWFSDRDAGMTVGSFCSITLSCKQTYADLALANEEASRLAYGFAKANSERVQKDINAFIEEGNTK